MYSFNILPTASVSFDCSAGFISFIGDISVHVHCSDRPNKRIIPP